MAIAKINTVNRELMFRLTLIGFLLIPTLSVAQFGDPFGPQRTEIKRSPIRKVLNMFSLTASTGYGLTLYSHSINGYTLLQRQDGRTLLIPDYQTSQPNSGYSSWLQDPIVVNDIRTQNNDFLVNSDTAEIGYRGIGNSIPINLSLHVDISNFRIGGGVSAEFHSLSKFSPISFEHDILNYEPEHKNALYTRWFGMIGYRVHNYWNYSFVPEIQFGKLNFGGNYNSALIDKGMFANLGVSIEKNFSEYFRAVIRPSVEFKNYTLNLGETTSIKHNQPAFFITAGISLNYPEIPRCKMNACSIQLKHVHGGKEFRGQPLWKKQNPKYGENHPDLIKYKGRNKRIRSPF